MSQLPLFDDLPPSPPAAYAAVPVRSHLRRVKSATPTPQERKRTLIERTEKFVAEREKDRSLHLASESAPVPHNGTATSREAAKVVEATGTGTTQKARILACLKAHKQTGLTRAELSTRLGIPINAVCGRVSQLLRENKAVETGETRKGESGVFQAIVWAGKEVGGPAVLFSCSGCKGADTLESRLFYITGRGYLTVRTCRKCGHREVG